MARKKRVQKRESTGKKMVKGRDSPGKKRVKGRNPEEIVLARVRPEKLAQGSEEQGRSDPDQRLPCFKIIQTFSCG